MAHRPLAFSGSGLTWITSWLLQLISLQKIGEPTIPRAVVIGSNATAELLNSRQLKLTAISVCFFSLLCFIVDVYRHEHASSIKSGKFLLIGSQRQNGWVGMMRPKMGSQGSAWHEDLRSKRFWCVEFESDVKKWKYWQSELKKWTRKFSPQN